MPVTLLAELLSDPERVTHDVIGVVEPAALVEAAEREQVVTLIDAALENARAPQAHRDAMRAAARLWALREAAERDAIVALLNASGGAAGIFFKGASVAYSVYPEPHHRMREDWDLLAAPDREDELHAHLLEQGFDVDRLIKPGAVRMRQRSYRKPIAGGECIVDVHARVFNPPALADRISYEDLLCEAVPLPRLHPSARGLSVPASLTLACVHRLAHHSDEPRLSWDYDVLLLAEQLDDAGALVTIAARWEVSDFVAAELARVFSRFKRQMPQALDAACAALSRSGARPHPYLASDRSRAREFALDWRSLSWRARASLARETFFPDAAYMRASTGSRMPLAWLYFRRMIAGAAGWFRSGRDPKGPAAT